MTHKKANDFYIDNSSKRTGPVVRWNSNDRIPFADMLQEFVSAGLISELMMLNSLVSRTTEDKQALENYRKNYKGPSHEELAEMHGAFGAGEMVVNVLTGNVIRL